ncbi:MAG: DUF1326 domain-containing protein [Candidatus Geothermarchaeales archaeon]
MSKQMKWKLKIEHIMACNCNWGCPCSFESPPTYGTCESALGYRIAEGRYGDVSLDGLRWVLVAAWPGPLHERNGRGVVFLDERAKGLKREALEAIATGKAGGPIGLFMSTVTAGLEVRKAEIEFRFAGKESSFRVGKQVQVDFEAIRNPVTGTEHQASVLLPGGMLTKREDYYSARNFSVDVDGLTFSYPGRNAIACEAMWRGP